MYLSLGVTLRHPRHKHHTCEHHLHGDTLLVLHGGVSGNSQSTASGGDGCRQPLPHHHSREPQGRPRQCTSTYSSTSCWSRRLKSTLQPYQADRTRGSATTGDTVFDVEVVVWIQRRSTSERERLCCPIQSGSASRRWSHEPRSQRCCHREQPLRVVRLETGDAELQRQQSVLNSMSGGWVLGGCSRTFGTDPLLHKARLHHRGGPSSVSGHPQELQDRFWASRPQGLGVQAGTFGEPRRPPVAPG